MASPTLSLGGGGGEGHHNLEVDNGVCHELPGPMERDVTAALAQLDLGAQRREPLLWRSW